MSLADDILIGAKAISDESGFKQRQVYRLAELGELPVQKVGGTLVSRRSWLREKFSNPEA
jgi:hypothetical protein